MGKNSKGHIEKNGHFEKIFLINKSFDKKNVILKILENVLLTLIDKSLKLKIKKN